MNLPRWTVFVLLLPAVLAAQITQQSRGNACLDLTSGKILDASYCVKPGGPIIWGNLLKGTFQPSNIVEFSERAIEPNPKFTPGWMELRTGKTHPDYEGRGPQAPYLRGRIDPKGYFYVNPDELKKWASAQEYREYKKPESPTPAKGDTSQACIRSLEGGNLEVRFTPKEITVNQTILWNKAPASPGTLAFQAGGTKSLQVELQFDSRAGVYDSYIRQLENLASVDSDKGRPPLCEFSWGKTFPHFTGVVENLSVKYTEFSSDGTPLRATINVRMIQASRLYNEAENRERGQ